MRGAHATRLALSVVPPAAHDTWALCLASHILQLVGDRLLDLRLHLADLIFKLALELSGRVISVI